MPGLRQIAPPLLYGQDGLFLEAALPAGPPSSTRGRGCGCRGNVLAPRHTCSVYVAAQAQARPEGGALALGRPRLLRDRLGVASSRSLGTLRGARHSPEEQGFREADVIVREGDAAEEIASEQAGSRYNLVVVGVGVLGRPRPGRRRSTAQFLLDRVTTPLLVVRGQPKPIERILICTAAGEPGKTGIRGGGWIARRLSVPVKLLYVTSGSDSPPSWIQSHLDRGVATLRDLEVVSSVSVRAAKSALDGILAEARRYKDPYRGARGGSPGVGSPSDRLDLTRQTPPPCPRASSGQRDRGDQGYRADTTRRTDRV
jgi:nucleotide-binding universal stress UspA family protein